MPPPDPSTLITQAPELASWGRRILGGVIDVFAVSLVLTVFAGTAAKPVVDDFMNGTNNAKASDLARLAAANILITAIYMAGFHAWRGSTPGKMAARTAVVMEDGSPITGAAAFVRAVTLVAIQFVSGFLIAPIILDILRPAWHPMRQSWHDQIARTVVVRA